MIKKIPCIVTTLGIDRKNVDLYTPDSIDQLLKDFKELRQKYENISVVSIGNNWGYGCNAPNVDNSLLINLSKCNKILDFNAYHGFITIHPGVTYKQLADFLFQAGDQWIAPVHGGGPNCSVMANVLERGYGITPCADHFLALQSLQAILNNGELYVGPLKKLGQEKLEKLFRYGIGPYTDGLFTQSGLGIVTEVTIRLAEKPKYTEFFYFNLKEEESLIATVEAIKKTKRQLGTNIGGINLMNKERCLSMSIDYPLNKIINGERLSPEEIKAFAQKNLFTSWLVIGMIYGEKKLVAESKKIVLKNFKSIKMRRIFYNSNNKKYFHFIKIIAAKLGIEALKNTVQKLEDTYDLLNGVPNNVALKLAYWKNPNKQLIKQDQLNPGRDNCGLIWYAPLVEMNGPIVLEYTQFIKESSAKFNFNALITLTTVDDFCFDSTIPILFNRENKEDTKNAYNLYQYLLEEGAKRGYFPYRLNIESQKEFEIQNSFLKIQAVNPHRYK